MDPENPTFNKTKNSLEENGLEDKFNHGSSVTKQEAPTEAVSQIFGNNQVHILV